MNLADLCGEVTWINSICRASLCFLSKCYAFIGYQLRAPLFLEYLKRQPTNNNNFFDVTLMYSGSSMGIPYEALWLGADFLALNRMNEIDRREVYLCFHKNQYNNNRIPMDYK